MKRLIVLILALCCISTGCEKSLESKEEVVSAAIIKQRFVGRFQQNINLSREYKDRMAIHKEQTESFDVYSLDLNFPMLKYEYTVAVDPQYKFLYSMQLDAENIVQVKQLGNGEENNVLLLAGKSSKEIAKNIGYSGSALVAVSPSKKYLAYCAANMDIGSYGLYLYDIFRGQSLPLMDKVDEKLLNDMEGSISWSPNEDYIAVAKSKIFGAKGGKLIKEINAESVLWSDDGSKLAFIRSEQGYGKSVGVLDMKTTEVEEVFISNSGEYLPGYMVWNSNETTLAFVTASIKEAEGQGGISPYKAIYSLDLTEREAIRVDTALEMSADAVAKLQSIHYNATGNLIAFTTEAYSGINLHVYNIKKGESSFYVNIEYLHDENNESYACSSEQGLYFVQGQKVIRLDEHMSSTVMLKAAEAVEDIYISKDGKSMVVVELIKDEMVLRQALIPALQ